MALLIAPGICRYAVHGEYAGQPIVNIIDMKIDTTATTTEREDAIDDQAGILINEWSDSVLVNVTNKYTAQSVSWVDLDEEDGSTGERSSTGAQTWPKIGSISGGAFPGNVALRINKNTVARRGQRQGRMYIVGLGENNTDEPNTLNTAGLNVWATAMESFLGDINQEDPQVGQYQSAMVVVHTKDQVFTSHSVITGLSPDQRLGSQRRRLDL